jgi:hypothetical protein
MVGSKLQIWCISWRMHSSRHPIRTDLLGVKPPMQSRLIETTIYVQVQADDALPVETSPTVTDRQVPPAPSVEQSSQRLVFLAHVVHKIPPRPGPVLSIRITSYMTVDTLAACVPQAVLHNPFHSIPVLDTRENRLVGLFCETLGLFVTLEQLLTTTNPSERQQMFTTHLPPPLRTLPPPSPTPWRLRWELWLLVSLLILISLPSHHKYTLLQVTEITVIWLYQSVIQISLQELYRYGPWFLGWEAGFLPQFALASLVTATGPFGLATGPNANASTLPRKERLARPFMWGLLMVFAVLFYYKPPPPPPPPPLDRDMVETY